MVDTLLFGQDFLRQLLSTLNFTELGPQPRSHSDGKEPPDYMLEMYNRFANDHTTGPSADIVRSFRNKDSSPHSVTVKGVRTHPLLFNVSIPQHEQISQAELRLYTMVQRDRRHYAGLDRKVTVYEVHGGGQWRDEEGKDGWLSFDLTRAVHLWHKSGCTLHRLQVHIVSVGPKDKVAPVEGTDKTRELNDVDIDWSLTGKHNPVILVYSDDKSTDHKLDKRGLNQMIRHENDVEEDEVLGHPHVLRENVDQNLAHVEQVELNTQFRTKLHSNLIYDTPPRIRRNAERESCKRTSFYVNFKDIGWDSWIVQPLGYEAYKCNGVCESPLTQEVTPTKHAIVQTLMSLHSPQKVSQACCVPTKLEPISMLYEQGGVFTYNHKYEGMVVAECGCR
ncbi:bone morphogenetic protein 10 [Aplochiton taeniatus]